MFIFRCRTIICDSDFYNLCDFLLGDTCMYHMCNSNILKNSVAVKKGAALFTMASGKKVVKLKGAAKKWL